MRPALIVGCGYTGLRLAARLRAAELASPVVGTTRSEARADELAAAGADPLVGDVSGRELLGRIARLKPGLVVYFVPPRRSDPLAGLLSSLEQMGVRAFLYASSTALYGDRGGGWVDETTAVRPESAAAKARYAAEQLVLDAMDVAGLPARICRITGIYGPERTLKGVLQSGDYVLIEGRDTWVNRIHVDDLVTGLIAVWQRGVSGGIYNMADDTPHRSSEFANLAAKLHGLPAPRWIEEAQARERFSAQRLRRKLDSKRVSNRRLREDLGVTLAYPTYKLGLPAAIAAELHGNHPSAAP
ncbi:MAG: NAD-dependent epimerase/dehydratase family protein [Gemmatimonadales bacterium]